MATVSKNKDIIFLLGAGASVEAGIPASWPMIKEIEQLMHEHSDWVKFLALYHHIKSSIHYSAGLKGLFGDDVSYNIETLVNTLYELERNEQHTLYPFIAAWNSRLVALAGGDFCNVKSFRRLILKKLKSWMFPEDPSLADYYHGFADLQRELNCSLRIFSLNYDMSVERLQQTGFRVEAGFGGIGPKYIWDWERFEDNEAGPPPPEIYLYKLHGSINWQRNKQTKELYCLEQTESIEPEAMEVIFGRDFKLEAADPYLFYAYEFRRFALIAKLVVVIGYGFADSHINKMIAQGLKADEGKRLLVISSCRTEADQQRRQKEVAGKLEVMMDQVVVQKGTAREFLTSKNAKENLLSVIKDTTGVPF